MSRFVSIAIRTALVEEKLRTEQELDAAYEAANHDSDRLESLRDWNALEDVSDLIDESEDWDWLRDDEIG